MHPYQLFDFRPLVTLLEGRMESDQYQIAYVSAGAGALCIDTVPYQVEQPTVFFLTPGQWYRWEASVEGKSLFFSTEFLYAQLVDISFLMRCNILDPGAKQPFLALSNPEQEIYRQLFALIEAEYSQPPTHLSYEVLRSYVCALVMHSEEIRVRQGPVSIPVNGDCNIYLNFRDQLEKQFATMQQVSDYAHQLALSPKKLNQAVQLTIHKSASEMIHDRILLEAKRRLHHTNLTVKEISYQLGFGEPSYFGKVFKKATGLTPESFRESSQFYHTLS